MLQHKTNSVPNEIVTEHVLTVKGKEYVGKAICKKEDMDNYSSVFGQGLAKTRAMISLYKEKISDLKKEIKTIEDYKKYMLSLKFSELGNAEEVHINRFLAIKKKELRKMQAFIKSLEQNIKDEIRAKENQIEFLKNKSKRITKKQKLKGFKGNPFRGNVIFDKAPVDFLASSLDQFCYDCLSVGVDPLDKKKRIRPLEDIAQDISAAWDAFQKKQETKNSKK